MKVMIVVVKLSIFLEYEYSGSVGWPNTIIDDQCCTQLHRVFFRCTHSMLNGDHLLLQKSLPSDLIMFESACAAHM